MLAVVQMSLLLICVVLLGKHVPAHRVISEPNKDFDVKQKQENTLGKGIRTRYKRSIVDFHYHPEKKWPLPIKYKIGYSISNRTHQSIIRRAISEWEKATCIKFQEQKGYSSIGHHVEFRDSFLGGCSSLVGMKKSSYFSKNHQEISLADECFESVGSPIHEIGHSLGLEHQMKRLDRNNYVTIQTKNIADYFFLGHNFNYPKEKTTTESIPYDLGSVMHYGALDVSEDKENLQFTIIPVEAEKIFVMGQEVEIGFYDAKIVNLEYCKDQIMRQNLTCLHNGYADPVTPGRCRCIPEWSGTHCEKNSEGSTGCSPSSGLKTHTVHDVGKEFALHSPNYLNTDSWSFSSGDQCFWHIQGPKKYQIAWWINSKYDGSNTGVYFGMHMTMVTSCQAWLEIRKPTETRGRRICGLFDSVNHLTNASRPVLSHSNELHISFRSFDAFTEALPALIRRGFYLNYKVVSKKLNYSSSLSLIDEVTFVRDSWKRLDPRQKDVSTTTTSYYPKTIHSTTSFWNLVRTTTPSTSKRTTKHRHRTTTVKVTRSTPSTIDMTPKPTQLINAATSCSKLTWRTNPDGTKVPVVKFYWDKQKNRLVKCKSRKINHICHFHKHRLARCAFKNGRCHCRRHRHKHLRRNK